VPTEKSPKTVTIYGRLSFPTWTAQAAYERSLKGQYPAKDVASAKPDFQLVLDQPQHDKLLNHIESVFLPYCVAQSTAGEKRDVLDAGEAKTLLDGIKKDLAEQTFNTPFKAVPEKTAAMAPEGVSIVKVIGNEGTDIELKAIVNHEDELLVPDADLIWTKDMKLIKPIGQTVHSFYPGCYVAVTLNLYAYHNGKHPGFSAGGSTAVFKADGDRFGGGATIDEDEIFAD
jgi:hypothetical protein